ncbi:MAG: DUF4040 domain-containing protein [Deltaproteobacteria bacterium]|nr:DUF4040 domain-containing protein [Deltaproteobacteria bacterium]
MLLELTLAIPVLLAVVAPLAWRRLGAWWPRVASLGALTVFVFLLLMLPDAILGHPQTVTREWMPQLGVTFALRADSFGIFMALIISGIGWGIMSYAGGYLGKDERTGSITGWLLLFMAAMIGVSVADNILMLFVSWEMTSFTSFMLIGTNHRDEESRVGAKQALLVTAIGGLALLGGLVILGRQAGTWNLSEMPAMHDHPFALGAFVLICLGAFTKSAQFPFSFWLPGAMRAPTPVSAYLHSATMVKAGVFLLARMHHVLGELPAWTPTLVITAAATMILVILAVPRATDLKALLAYSTIGALAIMVGLIGIGTDKSMTAMVVFLLAHACYKGPLFLVAGSIDHAVHSRDIRRLGGLAQKMPVTIVTGVIAGLSMVGIPPMLGFIAKEYALGAGMNYAPWVAGLITVLAMAFVLVAANVILIPAFGKKRELASHAHEAPWSMRVPMVVISSLGLILGVSPGLLERYIVGPAVTSLEVTPVHLSLWHGWNLPLLLSTAAVFWGGLAFWKRTALGAFCPALPSGPRIFDAIWNGTVGFGRNVTRILQNGSLTMYLGTIVVVACVLLLSVWIIEAAPIDVDVVRKVPIIDVIIAAVIAVSAVVTALARRRLPAIAALGAMGMGVTLFFLASQAPDLALTQFLVEILSVVILVIGFRHLPDFRITKKRYQIGRVAIAVLVGFTMSVMTLVALSTDYAAPISAWHGDNALTKGHGHNVVNVILVDFRGFDTFGEIIVLGIAALGVGVLVGSLQKLRKHNPEMLSGNTKEPVQ